MKVKRPGTQKLAFSFLVEAESEEEAFNKTEDLYANGQYSIEPDPFDPNEEMTEVTFDDVSVRYSKPDDIGDEYIFGQEINNQ